MLATCAKQAVPSSRVSGAEPAGGILPASLEVLETGFFDLSPFIQIQPA
jgi:hypothetical protein